MPKGKQSRSKRKTSRSGRNRTPISGHKRVKGQLITPFNASEVGKTLQNSSWVDSRLPEMLWAALIIHSLGRDEGLDRFRSILTFVADHERKEELSDLTLTGISEMEAELRDEIIAFIITLPDTRDALSSLTLFHALPAKDDWDRHLSLSTPDHSVLMGAVGSALWHQSQEATDCRWLRLMAVMFAGKMIFAPHLKKLPDMFIKYPDGYDENEVRPRIRAAEIGLDSSQPPERTWPNAFWQESWERTDCLQAVQRYSQTSYGEVVTRQAIYELRENLQEHWLLTHSSTATDQKHDAVFGMAFFALRTLEEMLGLGIGTSVLGRLGLRTILEVRINLKYLLTEKDPEIWQRWRRYGAGQAKLNALRFDEYLEPPDYIDLDTIESIASEDIWEELLDVNLSSWSGLDLRKISERSGLKDTYDKHYSWTSGYAHGMWGSVRESCFQVCANPLHRLHRYPEKFSLQDTVEDAGRLVDDIIEDLDLVYPSFKMRLFKSSAVQAGGVR